MTQNSDRIESDRAPNTIAPQLGSAVIPRGSGLIFTQKVSFQAWELIGEQLFSLTDSATWWIADWLAYGETSFQDRYAEAIKRTSLKYQTLRNYVWVARRFDLQRRHSDLSFGHHAEVAALEQPEQDYWLRKAEEFRWSRSHLRNEVRTSLRERSAQRGGSSCQPASSSTSGNETDVEIPHCNGYTATITLNLTPNLLDEFKVAAHSKNLDIANWAIQVLKAAAAS